jgi:RecJ-like exonuclease
MTQPRNGHRKYSVKHMIERRLAHCPKCHGSGVCERFESAELNGVVKTFTCWHCGLHLYYGNAMCEACKRSHRGHRQAYRCWSKQRTEREAA